MIARSGINVNSAVNRLTLCTAVQRTEINQILWKLGEEPSFNCIFGHRVSLSQVQILVCLRAEGTLGHATAWRSWWVHLYLELISCDAAEWPTLNTELLRFWCCFFPSFSSHCRSCFTSDWGMVGGNEMEGRETNHRLEQYKVSHLYFSANLRKCCNFLVLLVTRHFLVKSTWLGCASLRRALSYHVGYAVANILLSTLIRGLGG